MTPVKTLTRIHLTPSTKEFLRIVCGEKIENAQYRLKLLNKDVKHHILRKNQHTHLIFEKFFLYQKIKSKQCNARQRGVDAM